MLVQSLRERVGARLRNEESGFTLIELLVVMLIIGILAAIALPSFFNQRDKAGDAEAKSGVKTAQTAIETYATDNDGSYSGATVALLEGIEPTLQNYQLTMLVPPGSDTYTLRRHQPGHDQLVRDREHRRCARLPLWHCRQRWLPGWRRWLGRLIQANPSWPKPAECGREAGFGPPLVVFAHIRVHSIPLRPTAFRPRAD